MVRYCKEYVVILGSELVNILTVLTLGCVSFAVDRKQFIAITKASHILGLIPSRIKVQCIRIECPLMF